MLCLVEASEQCPSHCLGLHQATAIRPDKLIVPAGDSHPDDSTHDFILGRCANIQVPSVQGEGHQSETSLVHCAELRTSVRPANRLSEMAFALQMPS